MSWWEDLNPSNPSRFHEKTPLDSLDIRKFVH